MNINVSQRSCEIVRCESFVEARHGSVDLGSFFGRVLHVERQYL